MGEFTFNSIQQDAMSALEEHQIDNNRGIIVMPTGSGKTYLVVKWFENILNKDPDAKLLFISHSIDILNQAKNDEFTHHLKEHGLEYGSCYGYQHNLKQITFASVQALSFRKEKLDPSEFDYIIVDECHHAQSKTYREVLSYFNYKFLLGLTATPYRRDRRDLTEVLGSIFFSESAYFAIDNNILCNLEYYSVDNDIDFSNIEYNGRTYSEKDFNRKIGIAKYDMLILKEYRKLIKGTYKKKKTIAFCSTIAHAHRLSKFFNSHRIKAGLLVSESSGNNAASLKKRKEVIKEFKEGDTEIIFVRDMFNEGIDIPEADCAMLLRPTESNTIFHQQVGRVLRKAENKDFALILDFTGNARRFENTLAYLGEYANFDVLENLKKMQWPGFNKELIIIKGGLKIRLSRTKFDLINNYFANLQRNLDDAIEEFKKIYGEEKPKRTHLSKEHRWIYEHFKINNLLDKYCLPPLRNLNDAIRIIKEIYGDKKPSRVELMKDHLWIYCHFKKNKEFLDKYTRPSKNADFRTLDDAIKVFKEIYGDKKVAPFMLKKSNRWMYDHFLKNGLLYKYCKHQRLYTIEDAERELREAFGNRKPGRGEVINLNNWIYAYLHRKNLLDKYCKPSLYSNLKDAKSEYEKMNWKKLPTTTELKNKSRSVYYHFHTNNLLDKYCLPSRT